MDFPEHVLFFAHLAGTRSISGAESTLLFLMEEVRKQRPCQLAVPGEGMVSSRAAVSGIPVHVVPFKPVWEIKQREHDASLADRMRDTEEYGGLLAFLAVNAPALVVVNTSVNVMPALAAKELGIPVIWWLQEHIPRSPSFDEIIRLVDENSDWIFGTSQTILHPFRKRIRNLKKLQVLYPSWHPEEAAPERIAEWRKTYRRKLNLGDRDIVVGYVSIRMHRQKGLFHFLKAAYPILRQNRNLYLLVRSDPTDKAYSQRCLNWMKKKEICGQIRQADYVENRFKLYAAMDLLVVPSITDEGFGLTAMEGMIAGRTVIAYRSGGLREILRMTGNEDLLVPRKNTGLLRKVMNRAIRRPGFLEERGRKNREAARRAFGLEQYRDRVWKLFGKIFDEIG